MKNIWILIIVTFCFSQTKYELIDGTIIEGDIISETEENILINTKFGEISILKSEILIKNYTIVMNSGETVNGEKISEDETSVNIKTKYGSLTLNKLDILSMTQTTGSSNNNSRVS